MLQDDVLARLLTFPNVLVTSHQGFLTREALANIADTTLASITAFERGEPLVHAVPASRQRPAVARLTRRECRDRRRGCRCVTGGST